MNLCSGIRYVELQKSLRQSASMKLKEAKKVEECQDVPNDNVRRYPEHDIDEDTLEEREQPVA